MFDFTQLAPTSPNSIPSFFVTCTQVTPIPHFLNSHSIHQTQLPIFLDSHPIRLNPTFNSFATCAHALPHLTLTQLQTCTHTCWFHPQLAPIFSWFSTFIHTRPPYPKPLSFESQFFPTFTTLIFMPCYHN